MTTWEGGLAGALLGAGVLVAGSGRGGAARLVPRGPTWAVLRRWSLRPARAAPFDEGRAEVLAFVEALAAELTAGAELPQAMATAAGDLPSDSAVGRAVRGAVGAVRLGAAPADALTDAASRTGAAPLLPLAQCCHLAQTLGVPLVTVLDGLASGLRARLRQRRQVAVALAGTRASARLLAFLPLVGLALSAALGARPFEVLLATPVGWTCLLTGLALEALGLTWTARLARAATDG